MRVFCNSYRASMAHETMTMTEFGAKLRAIRRARGLSLSDVEALSKGRLKAVVLGSYERGSRSLSVRRAVDIAQLYEIPLAQLFAEKKTADHSTYTRTIFDLRSINSKAQGENPWSERFLIVARFTRAIVEARHDWNGEVLSMRSDDCKTLALVLNIEYSELISWLDREKVLMAFRK